MLNFSAWERTSRKTPCPICGKHGYCEVSRDQKTVHCMKVTSDRPANVRMGGYFHANPNFYDFGAVAVNVSISPAKSAAAAGDKQTIHEIYTSLLQQSGLNSEHEIKICKKRGLTLADLQAMGIASIPSGEKRARIVASLARKFGEKVLLSVPGFYRNKSGNIALAGENSDGIYIPARDLSGLITGLRVSPARPRNGLKYYWLSGAKYEGVAAQLVATAYGATSKEQAEIWITEGEYKAYIAAKLLQKPTISVPGVASWKRAGVLEMVEKLVKAGATVNVAYDNEINAATDRARGELCAALYKAGYKVNIATWEAHKGLDDLLQAGGQFELKPFFPSLNIPINRLISQSKIDENLNLAADKKISLIRSPRGTGKTHYTTRYIRRMIAKGYQVVVIGHRVTLLQEAAKRHGIEFYKNYKRGDQPGETVKTNIEDTNFAITLDSLPMLETDELSKKLVVIIDESEQVLQHLTGATIKNKRRTVLSKFGAILARAGKILMLDADLGELSYNFLTKGYRRASLFNPSDVEILVNTSLPAKLHYIKFEKKIALQSDLIAAISAGKKIYITTNSKEHSKILFKLLKKLFPEKRGWLLNADNSGSDDNQDKVKAINESVLDFDYMVVTPTLATGVSIDALHFDCVYLFGEAGVNTHYELLQQAARVRSPRDGVVKAWISPKRAYHLLDNPSEILECKFTVTRATARRLGISGVVNSRLANNPLELQYLELQSEVDAQRNKSFSELAANFWAAIEQEGHEISLATSPAKEELVTTRGLIKETKEEIKEEFNQGVLDARDILPSTYKELANKSYLSEDDQFKLKRFEIKRFYGTDVTSDLIEQDNGGKMRSKVTNFLAICDREIAEKADLKDYGADNESDLPDQYNDSKLLGDCRNLTEKTELRLKIMALAGLHDEELGTFDLTKPFSAASLATTGLAAWLESEDNRRNLYATLGMRINAASSLVKVVTGVLSQVGIECNVKQVRTGQKYVDDNGDLKEVRLWEYRVNKATYDLTRKLAGYRLKAIQAYASQEEQDSRAA